MNDEVLDSNENTSQKKSIDKKFQTGIPGVSDRVRAAVTDSVVMIVLSVIASQLLNTTSNEMVVLRGVLLVFIFVLYDPILTAIAGGTLGHRIMGLRVKRQSDETKNIPIHSAVIRYLIKVFLGMVSLLIVSKKSNRHAIHDKAVKSVVVYK